MRYFDLHCDTLYRAVTEEKSLNYQGFHISADKAESFESWVQCFAVWIPDDASGAEAETLFDRAYSKLIADCEKFNIRLCKNFKDLNSPHRKKCLFTVENGRVLNGDINMISKLSRCNVKILTLTWNGDNELGTGAFTKEKTGLTHFGREAVRELEKQGIIIDVSHASRRSFYDVAEIAKKPFIATHSNSKAVTNHLRNLTDEQFKIISDMGGLVGINFCRAFLNQREINACVKDIVKHTEHFLSLGGENCLAVGSDFDGCDIPREVRGIESIPEIYGEFLRLNYKETLLKKIFYENAFNFCENFDNC